MSIAFAISALCEIAAQANIQEDFSVVLKFKNDRDRSAFKWTLKSQISPALHCIVSSPNELTVEGIKVSLE